MSGQGGWGIGEKIAAWGVVAAVFVGVGYWVYDARQKEIDRQREDARLAREEQRRQAEEAAERPVLKFLSYREENGYYLLTLAHNSKTRTANIDHAFYRIRDEAQLARIRKIVPERYSGLVESANPVDDVFFRQGKWVSGYFAFGAKLSVNIPPGPANDLRLAILDPRFNGFDFVGELDVVYSAGTDYMPSLSLRNVTIKGRKAGK